jgi:hypothetical protein
MFYVTILKLIYYEKATKFEKNILQGFDITE